MGRSPRWLVIVPLCVALVTVTTTAAAVAAQPTPPTTNEQNAPPRNPLVEEAQRSREAVELFRSGERNFVPDPDIIGHPIDPPQVRPLPARPVPAVPRSGPGVMASLLLGLVGGLVGGCAALAGWAATTRRRLRQPASAT
jgi:hypothetical protein